MPYTKAMKKEQAPGQGQRATTLKDIAKLVGVSPTAVSLALNDKGSLTDTLRERIRETARALSYSPNPSARKLRGVRTNTIGIVINYFNNPFFRNFLLGLEEITDEAGVSYSVSQTHDTLHKEQALVRMMAEHGADGIIVLTCSQEYAHLQAVTDQFSIPVVLISHSIEDRFATVQADNIRGGRLAAEHLMSLGDRPLLHIAGIPGKPGLSNRWLGFAQAVAAARPDFVPEKAYYPAQSLTAAEGYQAMDDIMQCHRPPLGVFVVNDEVALGVLTYCRHHALNMPQDVAVVGFSDIDLLETLDIPLTSIRIPQRHMGATAAKILFDLIEHPENRLYPPITTLPVSLVVRESTVGPKKV